MDTIKIEEIYKHCRSFELSQVMILLNNSHQIVSSWGARSFVGFENTALRFTVNGHHHQGRVWIFLHANDTFEIYLTTDKDEIKEQINDIYIDELIDVLDKKIEWIEDYKN